MLARVKCDYRQTLAELHRESIECWTEWANRYGMLTRDQAHGSPANLLDVYATSDIPETEMFGAPEFPIPGFRRDPNMVRAAIPTRGSACWPRRPRTWRTGPAGSSSAPKAAPGSREHWHESLRRSALKLDLFFLTGVNQMLFHGSCYSPQDAPWPGWFFYAATKMDCAIPSGTTCVT